MGRYILMIVFAVSFLSCKTVVNEINENVDDKLSNRLTVEREDVKLDTNDADRVIIRDSVMSVRVFKPKTETEIVE